MDEQNIVNNGKFLRISEENFENIIPEPGVFYRVRLNGGLEHIYLGSLRLDNTDIDMATLKNIKFCSTQDIMDIIGGNYQYVLDESSHTETLDPYDVEGATDRDIEILLENYYKD